MADNVYQPPVIYEDSGDILFSPPLPSKQAVAELPTITGISAKRLAELKRMARRQAREEKPSIVEQWGVYTAYDEALKHAAEGEGRQVIFSMEEEKIDLLQAIAAKNGITLSQLINESIRLYTEEQALSINGAVNND